MEFFKNKLKAIATMFVMLCVAVPVIAQSNNDAVLFSIGDQDVSVSEFDYIYNKNNGEDANYSEESLNSYLDLYINFKLKVKEARAQGMDEDPALNRELQSYVDQLANSYLSERKSKDAIIRQTYDRLPYERNVQHILLSMTKVEVTKMDTMRAYDAASEVYNKIASGEMTFEQAVSKYSNDKGTKDEAGNIGWIHVPLPSGYEAVEDVVFQLKKNQVSAPTRSPRGYHIIRMLDERRKDPPREISQIFFYKSATKEEENISKKTKLERFRAQIQIGERKFEDVAKLVSDDAKSKDRGGYIGFVNHGAYEKALDDAIFNTPIGSMSQVVESSVGYHIIKVLGEEELGTFEDEKQRIARMLENSNRFKNEHANYIKRLKRELNVQVDNNALKNISTHLGGSFFTYKWVMSEVQPYIENKLFSIEDEDYDASAFIDYLQRHPRERMTVRQKGPDAAINILFESYIDDEMMKYQKEHLVDNNPEFAAIVNEYSDGILLFEITKERVWDVASEDSIGIQNYFETHRENYKTDPKLDVTIYRIENASQKDLRKIEKAIKKSNITVENISDLTTLAKVDYADLSLSESKLPQGVNWKENMTSPLMPGTEAGTYEIYVTKQWQPSRLKTLDECRGYVIADYQKELEASWVKELKNKYPVKINQDVLKTLVK